MYVTPTADASDRKSVSALSAQRQAIGEGYTGFITIVTLHLDTSTDPVHFKGGRNASIPNSV
jgi:hypothetical protein